MNILYLFGNGFDLNLGLKTSYTDFYNYYNSLTSTTEKVKFLKESISENYKTSDIPNCFLNKWASLLSDKNEALDN